MAQPGHRVGPGAVPWVNRPAPAYVPPPQPRLTAAYPPCQARQLAGTPGRGGPAAGTVYQEIRLTNRSDRSCTLSGGPAAVTGVQVSGVTTTLTRVAMLRDGYNLVGPGPANLRPGQSGWVTLAYGDGCPALTSGGKADYRTLFIWLSGGRVRVAFPVAPNLVCGVWVSGFGVPPPAPPSSTSPLNALTATVAVPASVGAGGTASYTVTLRNIHARAVRLTPCPSYTEYLGVSLAPGRAWHVTRNFYLNCAAVGRIAPHASITFAMRMPVPDHAGPAKLLWQLQDTNVGVALTVTIRSRSN